MFTRIPFVILAAAALVAMPGSWSASAHPSIRESWEATLISCDYAQVEGGSASFLADISPYGGYAGAWFWADPADPEVDPPTWFPRDSQVTLSGDGAAFEGTVDLYERVEPEPEAIMPQAVAGEYVGQAIINLTLVPAGEPEHWQPPRMKGSNQHVRSEGWTQPLAVSGEVSLPEGIVMTEFTDCYAVREASSIFGNAPDSYVERTDAVSLTCEWLAAEPYVFLNAYSDRSNSSADVFVVTASGHYHGGGGAVLDERQFSTGFDLYLEPEYGDDGAAPAAVGPGELAGSVAASATLTTVGDSTRQTDAYGNAKVRLTSQPLAADGALVVDVEGLDLALSIDDASCQASSDRVKWIESTPNRPKPHGRPLPNDLPAAAEWIAVGEAVTVASTAGSDPEPEVSCTMSDPEWGEYAVPLGYTAWWTFNGSGSPVTVDTTGSDFDTVVGIYTFDGDAFAQLVCVDDIWVEPDGGSVQAVATVDTEPDIAYSVQVGGFNGAVGRLELTAY